MLVAAALVVLAAGALVFALVSALSPQPGPATASTAGAPLAPTPPPTAAAGVPPSPEPTEPTEPAPPQPNLDLPIAGWVIDGAGTPIAGVAITRRDASGASPDELSVSEPDGAFRLAPLEAGERRLLLDATHVFAAEMKWIGGDKEPRIMLTRRMQLDARVAAAGAPVVGAEVHISDGSSVGLATAITGADGVAHFEDLLPGPYELWARREGMVSPLVRTVHEGPDARTEIALALASAGSVHGQINGDGALPTGATVQLIPIDLDHAARVVAVDAGGQFAVEGVPAGKWRVAAEAPGHIRNDDITVEVVGKRAQVAVRLRRAGVVSGSVVDADGVPVKNATLVLRAQGPGDQRSFAETLPVAPRSSAATPASASRLRWVHPLAFPRQMPIRDSRRFGAVRNGTRPAECGRGHCGLDLGGKKGVTVHAAADGVIGRLVPEIRKSSGRYVMIEHAGGLRTFYMHLDALRGDLQVGQPIRAGEPIGTLGRTGVIKSGPHLHFALAQERHGRSYFIDAEAIMQHAVVLPVGGSIDPGVPGGAAPTVIASLRDSNSTTPRVDVASTSKFTTDDRGTFRLEGVEPGTYVAAAFHADLAPGVSGPFEVRIGEQTGGIVVTLARGVRVEGLVLGRKGPIRGARIVVEEGFGETVHKVATAVTDKDGHYVLRALSGKLTLSVTATGHGTIERAISLDTRDRNGGTRHENFELSSADSQLYGMIIEPGGSAAAGVTIRIVDGPTLSRRATTGRDGRFAIDNIAAGSYTVELSSADYPGMRMTMDTNTRNDVRVAQGGSIELLLLDAHTGRSLDATRVDAAGPDGAERKATTDDRGVAELRALQPGRWTLRVRAVGYVAGEASIDVVAGRSPQEVRVELSRGAILAGTVYDAYGRRIAGAKVWVGYASTHTDADGDFRLDDAPTGKVELHAELDDLHGVMTLELRPGDEQVTLKVDVAE